MSSNTNNLRAIMETLVKHFASLEEDSDGPYWWGHDTNLGDQSEAFDEAIAAITALIPEKRRTEPTEIERQLPSDTLQRWQSRQMAYNLVIDQIHTNFKGGK